jgi:hypothetical protein
MSPAGIYRMKTIMFILGALFIAYFSWQFSLKAKRYHGIYRFFYFESILALVLFIYSYWFDNPLSLQQIF